MNCYLIQRAGEPIETRFASTAREAVRESNAAAANWPLYRGRPHGPILGVAQVVVIPAAEWADDETRP